MKKILAIVLALACVLSLCACGGAASQSGSTSQGSSNKGSEGKVTLKIGLPTSAMVLDHKENALTKWVEEQCNVNLIFEEYAGGSDVATQISTAIAARQELPDILYGVMLGESAVSRYGKDGYLLDLSDYYADKEGVAKNFWSRIDTELTTTEREIVLRKITDAETGAIYGVPAVETSLIDSMRFQMWINKEWLDYLKLDIPTNNEELYTVLKAFKEKDPNQNGKADEIPLFGSQAGGLCSNVIDWLINLFIYYNPNRKWNIDENGTIYPVYTTDEYREALKFINKLYKEQILTQLAWTTTSSEMKQIITPANGTALVGVFAGHLSVHTTRDNEVMYQYVPMQTWGYAVRNDLACHVNTFITEDCEYPDKAFEVLMTLWSKEGSMRVRYGEYGVNWDYPDEGAVSELGLPAAYKLHWDPLNGQTTAKWSFIASAFNTAAEGETAQMSDQMTEWQIKKAALHAESVELFQWVEENRNNPDEMCPLLTFTEDEKEETSVERTNVDNRASKAQAEFCTGTLNPNSDADWNAYLKQLNELGLEIYQEYMQKGYDRGGVTN